MPHRLLIALENSLYFCSHPSFNNPYPQCRIRAAKNSRLSSCRQLTWKSLATLTEMSKSAWNCFHSSASEILLVRSVLSWDSISVIRLWNFTMLKKWSISTFNEYSLWLKIISKPNSFIFLNSQLKNKRYLMKIQF